MRPGDDCSSVSYHIVSFLIPKLVIVVYVYISRIIMVGSVGLTISRTQRNILRYSSIGIEDTGIVPDTGAICHDSP